MPTTPERARGESLTEGIQLENLSPGNEPSTVGEVRCVDGDFLAVDGSGSFNLRSGSGLTEGQHEDLDSLVHALSEDCYEEVTRTAGKVSNVTVWTSAAKTTKVRETVLQRSGGQVSQIDVIQYGSGGAEVQRMTGVVARSGGRVTSVTWTETVS